MIAHDFPGKGKVAVLRTRPETVVEDVGRLMDMAGYRAALPQDQRLAFAARLEDSLKRGPGK